MAINVDCGGANDTVLKIGRQGESLVETVIFDLTAFIELYGEGETVLVVKRNGDDVPYPVILDVVDNTATWNVTNIDTAKSGFGKIQISYLVDNLIKKTVVFTTYVESSIEENAVPPDPYESYLDEMVELGSQVHREAEQAEQALADIEALIAQGAVVFSDTGDGNIAITFPTGGN